MWGQSLTCILVLVSVSLFGCVRLGDRSPQQAEPRTTLSLPVPQLGPVQFPDKSPYANRSRSESAYFDGFAAGWRIIQDAGEGALVYAPEEYSADDAVRNAWHKGVVDGKSSAYEKIRSGRGQPSN